MTQAQVAAALPNPVHAKTVGRWERGDAHPRGQLTALERVLGVRLTNGAPPATSENDPLLLSDDELVALLYRLVGELARRLPSGGDPLSATAVLERGLTATRRGDDRPFGGPRGATAE